MIWSVGFSRVVIDGVLPDISHEFRFRSVLLLRAIIRQLFRSTIFIHKLAQGVSSTSFRVKWVRHSEEVFICHDLGIFVALQRFTPAVHGVSVELATKKRLFKYPISSVSSAEWQHCRSCAVLCCNFDSFVCLSHANEPSLAQLFR